MLSLIANFMNLLRTPFLNINITKPKLHEMRYSNNRYTFQNSLKSKLSNFTDLTS